MATIQELWLQYYPVILTIGAAIMAFAAGAFIIWTQVKPMLVMVKALFDKMKGAEVTDVTSLLQQNDMATKITDLKAKLANPTTSDELKGEYTVQLTQALEIKAKLDAGLVKADEITNKFL